jgi:hypothetical protein
LEKSKLALSPDITWYICAYSIVDNEVQSHMMVDAEIGCKCFLLECIVVNDDLQKGFENKRWVRNMVIQLIK